MEIRRNNISGRGSSQSKDREAGCPPRSRSSKVSEAGGVSEGRAEGNRATSHQAPQAFTLREMRSIQVMSRGVMQTNILKGTLGLLG